MALEVNSFAVAKISSRGKSEYTILIVLVYCTVGIVESTQHCGYEFHLWKKPFMQYRNLSVCKFGCTASATDGSNHPFPYFHLSKF